MAIKIATVLLDGCVLGLLEERDYYGYELTKQVQSAVAVSNSTMYPVMRRLKAQGLVTTYDQAYQGRNRRYYRITDDGQVRLKAIRQDWQAYQRGINQLLGSDDDE